MLLRFSHMFERSEPVYVPTSIIARLKKLIGWRTKSCMLIQMLESKQIKPISTTMQYSKNAINRCPLYTYFTVFLAGMQYIWAIWYA